MPELHLDKQLLSDLANQTVNKRIAVTGVQPKLSVDLETQKNHGRLTIVGLWGRYILKPQHSEFQFMPETEDLTMHLADLFRIRTCEHALIRTSEGNLAYLAKRFDRNNQQKIHVEDFCQLSGFLTEQKYKGSYEKIGKLIHLYCTNKGFDALNYFEIVLFCFLTGNNDMHLKNFSIIHHDNNEISLSPAYDLLNVNLVFPSDPEELGLTLNGRKRKITLADFNILARSLNLPERAVENAYQKFKSGREKVVNVVNASFLPDDWKLRYIEIWDHKNKIFY
ncbi:HipA domain-containing protein [Dyadobacter sp. CY107]|uniref:HipA domain-containing protein n=1 Tax=Dyadobacter fanqingshengii TaxID=2906443 RepID=UPI001F1C9194|nr:HipA domain-containing protein [Dyadobacter fanqingshengii]MCF2504847.1 HipA domain-containing protein [Dyadobacter fanqingshengii]